MKRNFFLILSTILTLVYLMIFSSLSHGLHIVLLLMILGLLFYTGKVTSGISKVSLKFRIWINSLFFVIFLFPVLLTPSYFSLINKFFRIVISLILVLEFFYNENKRIKSK